MWIIDLLIPPENATPGALHRHRWVTSAFVIGLTFCAMFAASPRGFAWGGDVDKKITAAVEPLAKEQAVQSKKLDDVTKLLTEQLAATVAAQIRLTISKRCKTQGFIEREELNREKDRLQAQYFSYKGEYYRELACADL